MLWLRKIVFYIFVLIYLILCPLIVGRMLGFVINPLTHHWVKTGLVYVATNPPNARVLIDGRLAHNTTPTIIRDLTPGEHFIRLQLDGYKDWGGKIPIVGKQATIMGNTLLIPEQWPIKKISNKPYQNLIPASEGILVGINPTLKDIDVFRTLPGSAFLPNSPLGRAGNSHDQNNYEAAPLCSENSIYAEGQLIRIFNADKSPFILLEAAIKDKHKFLWVSLKEKPPLIEDITDLFSQVPDNIAWGSWDDKTIFAFYPHHMDRINVKTKTVYLKPPHALPAGISPNPPSGKVDRTFLINNKNDLLIREGRWIRLYPQNDFGIPEAYDIARSRALTNMYFEEKNGELFYLDDDTMFLYAVKILH